MTIENVEQKRPPRGWLQIDTAWLARLFQLKETGELRIVTGQTGELRVITGQIQVGVEDARLEPGQVVHGHFIGAIVPVGWAPDGDPVSGAESIGRKVRSGT